MALTKILLVDDDEVVRYSLGRILEETGFAVTTAANVTEALKYITSDADHPPQVRLNIRMMEWHLHNLSEALSV